MVSPLRHPKHEYAPLPLLKQVPGRDLYSTCSWERHAWPSRKSLSSWLTDLVERVGLLRRWTAKLSSLPNPFWLPGLFNPTAFLTALKQVSSRKLGLPLDKITVETRVTCMETSEETAAVGALPPQGALVNGFFIEGARWNRCGQVSPSGINTFVRHDHGTTNFSVLRVCCEISEVVCCQLVAYVIHVGPCCKSSRQTKTRRKWRTSQHGSG